MPATELASVLGQVVHVSLTDDEVVVRYVLAAQGVHAEPLHKKPAAHVQLAEPAADVEPAGQAMQGEPVKPVKVVVAAR